MGFEQLASLRDELAQQAAAEKLIKQQKKKEGVLPAKRAAKVDPVVMIIGQLQKKFPLAFPKNPAPKVPLKIGIHKELFELSEQLGINKSDIRAAIKRWCWGNRYWECLLEGAARVDLYGNAAGQVAKVEADQARTLREGRRKKTDDVDVMPNEGL